MFQRQGPYQRGMNFPRGTPTQPFMGQMFGHPQMMRNSPFPPQQGRGNPMMRNGGVPQMRGQGNAPMRQGGGGGFLSRLLGGGGNQAAGLARGALNPASVAAPASDAGGGILSALTNPSTINGFLSNTQKVLNTASQFGPMVQQYGPLVKNIPAMWKMYQGMNDSGDNSTNDNNDNKVESQLKNQPSSVTISKQESHPAPPKKEKKQIGMSKPKLYI